MKKYYDDEYETDYESENIEENERILFIDNEKIIDFYVEMRDKFSYLFNEIKSVDFTEFIINVLEKNKVNYKYKYKMEFIEEDIYNSFYFINTYLNNEIKLKQWEDFCYSAIK